MRGCVFTPYTTLSHTKLSRIPATPANQKHCFHPHRWAIQPKIGRKSTNAKYCDELKMADDRPRSAVGNQLATIRPFPGNTGDCASPDSSRNAKIAKNAAAMGRYPANPASTAHSDHPTMLAPYTRFDP